MNKRVKAFTILELLVAMVILCLMMGLCFTLYQTTFKNYLILKRTNQQIGTASGLCKLIGDDFFYCTKATVNNNSLYFYYTSKPGIAYVLNDSAIVRTQSNINDTFKLGKTNCNALFEGKNLSVGLIDELTITLKLTGEPDTFRFQKNYGADILLLADSINLSKKI